MSQNIWPAISFLWNISERFSAIPFLWDVEPVIWTSILLQIISADIPDAASRSLNSVALESAVLFLISDAMGNVGNGNYSFWSMWIPAGANVPTTLGVAELVACVKSATPLFASRTCSTTCFKEYASIFF